MTIKIENGCIHNMNGTWTYNYTTTEGPQTVSFVTVNGDVPEFGDFITDGRLKKRESHQINNDGRLKWPSDNKEGYVQVGKLYEK